MKTNKLGALPALTLIVGAGAGCIFINLDQTFRTMDELFPTSEIENAGPVHEFSRAEQELDVTYQHQGKTYTLDDLHRRTQTTGFLVVKDDVIVHERYLRGGAETSNFTSWSMAKSFVSALVGIAIEEGHIDSVDDPITKYVPELAGSGYDGVSIKHVLQMSSGIDFKETYWNLGSDVYLMMLQTFYLQRPVDDYVAKRKSESPAGDHFYYASTDTQALGMLISRTTGMSVADYLEQKIWTPLGMESEAHWNVDVDNVEYAYCCLNARLRDFARFGRLYLHQGNWNGVQVVPAAWVKESVTPDRADLMPEANEGWGYQHQWWILDGDDGEFMAVGVFCQFIYVNPAKNLVIVKTSSDRAMAEDEVVAAFRAIADSL